KVGNEIAICQQNLILTISIINTMIEKNYILLFFEMPLSFNKLIIDMEIFSKKSKSKKN
ncbi:MAG: hypothetical protein RLZZ490_2133, partial [Cyanobacteriota bacterium]